MKLITLEQVLSVGGKRRAAFVVADACLRLNEFRPLPSEEDEAFICPVARGEETGEAIAEWPETHALIESAKERGRCQLVEDMIGTSICVGER